MKKSIEQIKEARRLRLVNQRFGKLVVLSLDHIHKRKGATYWKCKCDCGNEKVIRGSCLTSKNKKCQTKSCGCMMRRTRTNHPAFRGFGEISKSLWNRIIRNCIRGHNRDRIIEFTITMEYAWNLFLNQNRKCALTKLPLELFHIEYGKTIGNASLDRIDSSKGYIEGNVQWIHKDVNMMKYNFNQDYFIKLCKLIASENQ